VSEVKRQRGNGFCNCLQRADTGKKAVTNITRKEVKMDRSNRFFADLGVWQSAKHDSEGRRITSEHVSPR